MARLNIEADWFKDETKRRAALIAAVAQRPRNPIHEADGLAVDAWLLAQQYWKQGRRPIPEDVWRRAGLEPMIDAGLAERTTGGVYVKGTKERHEWIAKKVDAGAESADGRARDERGRLLPKGARRPGDAGPPSSTPPGDAGRGPARHQVMLDSSANLSSTPPAPVGVGPDGHQPLLLSFSSSLSSNSSPQSTAPPVDKSKRLRFAEEHLVAAEILRDFVVEKWPEESVAPQGVEVWADELRVAEEQDGVSMLDVVEIVHWAFRADAFWQYRIQSPSGLRRNWSTLVDRFKQHQATLANH